MPAKTTRDTILRQWELLHLLPAKGPGDTATELARKLQDAGYNVSKRQVERDLNDLYDAMKYAITCNNGSAPYGWHWKPGTPANFPDLTLAEALSLNVIEETLKPLLPKSVIESLAPRFKQAQGKLSTLQSSNRTARWVNKVRTVSPTLPLMPPKVDAAVLTEIQEALLADEQVQVSYRAAGLRNPKQMRLHPLGLIQRGPVTYLIATAFQYTEPWIFAVHRFTRAERTGEPLARPAGFDLDQYLATGALQFGTEGTIRLQAEISSGLAGILAETPLSADQTIDIGADSATVTATLPNTQQLRHWLLSQGAGLKVLHPASLRGDVAAECKAMAARYAAS